MAQHKLAKRQFHQVLTTTREGEGVVVGIVRERLTDGMMIQLDFSGAPVPERRFSADAAWVAVGTDMVRVLFAQFKASGPEIEHVVVLRLPFAAVRQFVKSMKGVAKTAHDFLARIDNPSSPPADRKNVPNQTFTIDANILVAGFSGREACMDLYNSSPQVKVALKRGSAEFRAEPIARVALTTRLMTDIHDELASKIDTLPNDGSGDELEVEAEQ